MYTKRLESQGSQHYWIMENARDLLASSGVDVYDPAATVTAFFSLAKAPHASSLKALDALNAKEGTKKCTIDLDGVVCLPINRYYTSHSQKVEKATSVHSMVAR